MAVVTGHGATLAFGTTTAWAPDYTSIGSMSLERPALDSSHLGTTGVRTKLPGDLYELSPFTASFFFEPEASDNPFDTLLFDTGVGAAAETISLTYPTATILTGAGSGFVTGFEIGELVTDQLMTATITVQYADWPTFS